jgi:mannose-1-phosphate guanylyltransferase
MSHAQNRWEPHLDTGHDWALVLAAGEGSRLRTLTTTASGIAIPKQFCSMGGGESLLHSALRRAQRVVPRARTCAVVAEQHRRWWQALPLNISAQNLTSQPRNRGTANGILLPLLRIVHRDPDATLLILPSDHYVRNEEVLASSLRQAIASARDTDHLVLLGFTPDEPDPELGYIVGDGADAADIRKVKAFVEKPDAATARELMGRGGRWNSFIFAASARSLLRAFEERSPELVKEMQDIITASEGSKQLDARLSELYARLPELDFSRDVLQRAPSSLRVLTVPPCGWSDLGTPRRVVETVNRYAPRYAPAPEASGMMAFLDLAVRQSQPGVAAG